MDISDAVELVKSLDPVNKEAAENVVKELRFLTSSLQNKLEEIGLRFEIEVSFGNQWLYGMDGETEFDEDGYDSYNYLKKGSWVSSGDFPC